jgi:PAS domain S-box-containing protein
MFKYEAKLVMGGNENVFERNVLISTRYIEVDDNPIVLLSIDDITERVQRENILREKNSILLKTQEIAKIGEFYYDVKGRSFKLSENLTKIAGLSSNILSIDELYESIHPDDRDETKRVLVNAIEHLDRYTHLYRRYKASGEIQYILTSAEVERDENGKAKRVFGVSADITEQKKVEIDLQTMNYELQIAEEELRSINEELFATNDALKENLIELEVAKMKAEESDRLKSAFLANMSHEVRTPMNAIMGFANLLDMEDMPFEKRKKFTQTIKQRTNDLLNIINDILDISRIESHTMKIIERKGNVNDVLVEIKNFFQMRDDELSAKSISFEVNNELIDDENNIQTDFDRLKQVLINLIDNAYKYTLKGKIYVGCKFVSDYNLMFYVKDTGIGISQEKLSLVFERFRQVDESYLAREFGGTGLGLSICKGIIELIDGRIWVESEVGKGSTFSFTIPYKRVEKPKALKKQTIKRYDFTGKTILLVEDVGYNMDYLAEILLPTNALLLKAVNGVKALEAFRLHPEIDLILMDIRLPDTNGFELTKKMVAERRTLKVIAQTAYASEDDRVRCFEAGCVDFVTKPISLEILLDLVSRYLPMHQ